MKNRSQKRFANRKKALVVKGTTSPAERCDLGSVKLEKVHEFFQVCLNLCQRNCDNI